MAVTVDPITDGDFTRINRADATTGWTAGGSFSMIALDTTSAVENTGCMQVRVPAGIGSLTANFTSRSMENVHLRHWMKLGQSISAGATYGARLVNGTDANHGSWIIYDDAKQVVVYNGWMMLVVDPRKPYDAVVGTAPADILAIVDAGTRIDYVDGNGKDLVVGDMLWEGNEISIEGGTTGARGTFDEWATDDESNGYGILRNVGGIYYMNAGAVFQGPGTETSYFEDSNQVIVFEDLPVSGSIYTLRHVGNATGTNHFQLGTTTGSGVDQAGAGGGVIRAAGAAPFRIEAIDANVDAVNYYGVTMLGPTTVYADQLRNVKIEDNGTGFTDITAHANGGAGRTDQILMPATQAVNDATYFGHDERFYALNLNLVTAKGGTWTGTWEYWDGAAWSSLVSLTDGTANYATTGVQAVNWAIPDDWAVSAIDSDTRYWVRFRISSFTSSGTNPTQESNTDGTTVDMTGDIRLEDANVDMVGCTLTGMGSIRLRGGAFLKKTTINSSNAPAKHAAVDLGGANPAADTFRDMVIQNCVNGVLIRPATEVTYDLKAISFSGNTFDIINDGVATQVSVYAISNQDATIPLNNVNHGTGQSVSGVVGRMASCQFYLSTTGSPTGSIVCRMYGTTGTHGIDAIPSSAAPLATSETVAITGVSGTLTLTKFQFHDDFNMSAGIPYFLSIEYTGGDVSNFLNVGSDNTSPTDDGNSALATTGFVWTADDTEHVIHDLYHSAIAIINITEGGTTPTVSTTNNGSTIVINAAAVTINGITEGTAVKVIANENSGSRSVGDVLFEGWADLNGEATFNFSYESAFDPSGLDVIIRARQQGLPNFALANTSTVIFVNETTFANSAASDDMSLVFNVFPVAGADWYYFGHPEQFSRMKLDVSTAVVASPALVLDFEYWNGSAWTNLSGVVDGTSAYTITGENTISWTPPGDWAKVSAASSPLVYYVRIGYASGTLTTAPRGRKCKLDVTRYLPFVQNNTIKSSGLTVTANWTVDSISIF